MHLHDHFLIREVTAIYGKVIAEDVTYSQFLDQCAGQHVEWAYGKVIEMSPVSARHSELVQFLNYLFAFYLARVANRGRIYLDPMIMKPLPELPARQLDLQLLLEEHLDRVEKNQIAGAADLVVEVISPESRERDRINKFQEYERGGIPEYWILDPEFREAHFYTLEDGVFTRRAPDVHEVYTSKVLPYLRFPVTMLWRDPLPFVDEILSTVASMFKDSP